MSKRKINNILCSVLRDDEEGPMFLRDEEDGPHY